MCGSLKATLSRLGERGSHVVSCSGLFFARRDDCASLDGRSDCQVRVAFTWTWKVRGDGRDWRRVGACDARVFRKLHFRPMKSFHIFHALSAFPVAVHRVLFLFCHVM